MSDVSNGLIKFAIKQKFERDGSLLQMLSPKLGLGADELKIAYALYSNDFGLQASNADYYAKLREVMTRARAVFTLFGVCIENEHTSDLVEAIGAAVYPITLEAPTPVIPLTPLQAFVLQYRPALDVRVMSEESLIAEAGAITAELATPAEP